MQQRPLSFQFCPQCLVCLAATLDLSMKKLHACKGRHAPRTLHANLCTLGLQMPHLGVVLAQLLGHNGVQGISFSSLVPRPVLCEVGSGPPAHHGCHALRYLKGSPRPLIRHCLNPATEGVVSESCCLYAADTAHACDWLARKWRIQCILEGTVCSADAATTSVTNGV